MLIFKWEMLIYFRIRLTYLLNRSSYNKVKSILSILFLFVYVSTALGIGIDYHFCGGKVVDAKLAGFSHAHCNCPKGSMPKDCCRNELHFYQTDNHKIQGGATLLPNMGFPKEPVLFTDFIYPLAKKGFTNKIDLSCNHYRCKYKSSSPVYILNNVFRI